MRCELIHFAGMLAHRRIWHGNTLPVRGLLVQADRGSAWNRKVAKCLIFHWFIGGIDAVCSKDVVEHIKGRTGVPSQVVLQLPGLIICVERWSKLTDL